MDFIVSDNPRTKLKFVMQQEGDDPSVYPKPNGQWQLFSHTICENSSE